MPNRWPISSGNWSNPAIWSGSLIPTASDDVYSNNFTINMDTSFEVLSLRSTAITGVTAGGIYNFNSGSISGSITSISPIVTTSNLANLIVTASEGTITLRFSPGAVLGGGGGIITYAGNCNLDIQGGVVITGPGNANGGILINKTSAGTLIITGSLTGANSSFSSTNALRIATNSSNTIISGSVIGGMGANSNLAINQGVGNLTIIGNVSAGLSLTAHAISTGTTGTITITGSVAGTQASAGTGNAISSTSTATINILGDVTAGFTPAISSTGASTLTVRGAVTSTINVPAIVSSNASATNIFTGPLTNVYDTMAAQCVDMVLTADADTFWDYGSIKLYSPSQLQYYPSASDIRENVTYSDGTLSGSLAMPSSSLVIAGTPTDNTTGSAVLTPSQLQDNIWGRDLAQMTVTESIGYRLARAATTDSTGKQIASYLV